MGANTELKITDHGDSMTIAGYGLVFDGQDLAFDRFTRSTDLWLDGRLSQKPPVLFGHGQDKLFGQTVLGHVVKAVADDVGIWIEAKLEASKRYLDLVRKLMAKGIPLGWSSGSVPHLVQRTKSATPGVQEITVWPVVEWSIVDTPAEPRTLGVKELKSLAAVDPLLLPIAREAEQVQAAKEAKAVDLPDSAFAFIEDGGTLDDEKKTFPRMSRHYPHHTDAGDVDMDTLAAAIVDARKATDPAGLAHLMRHAHALESGEHDDAHTKAWAAGAAPKLLVLTTKLADLAERVAKEQTNMLQLDMDIKDGLRIRPELSLLIEELLHGGLEVVKWAQTVDRGEDGRARVDLLRHKLALMELEV